jgi:2,4-didehydro-3-deoxy-L-rhamnonate hydrolase
VKLIRCGAPGQERPGVLLDDGRRLDTSAFARDYDEAFFTDDGVDGPREPVIFFKATTSLCGPNDAVMIPRGGTKLDWEVELAVVIGRVARYVDQDHAGAHVAGYALHNDYSERAFQLERGGQWVKG